MLLRRSILLFLAVLCAFCSSAQRQGEYVQARILVLLDQSSSMIQPWANGKEKYKAAREIIDKLMDSIYTVNNQVQFGLRVFGHQHTVPENDCYDTKFEVPFSPDNRSQMYLRLEDIHPLGVTPIAFALKEAAEKDIVDEEHYLYSIILITDGGESCGGDICEVMKTLVKNKVFFKPYILSLENDPTLRTTYACMGDYLQVTSNGDIPKAINTIVEAFRPRLQMLKSQYKEIQSATPSAKKPKHAQETIPTIYELAYEPIKTSRGDIKLITVQQHAVRPLQSNRVVLTLADDEMLFKTAIPRYTPSPVGTTKLPAPALDSFATTAKNEKVTRLPLAQLRRFNIIFVPEERSFPLVRVPQLPPLKLGPTPTTATTTPANTAETKTEDSKETSLEVYFTNGAGKFYPTTPQMLLLDPATNNVVKKFYRTVDGDGNPDPQTNIPPGIYDITFVNKRDIVVKDVKIEANKKNKVTITVKNTSLSFAYERTPGETGPPRPVSEFTAIVTERNKSQGRVQRQACTEKMLYEPGNYHIEINTFPMDMRNLDIDIDGEWVITIPQPGFAKFVSDGTVGSVDLYQHLGDKFVRFSTIRLSDPASQHLQIQPGKYQAHYLKGPGQSGAAEKVKIFQIKPKEETQIELN